MKTKLRRVKRLARASQSDALTYSENSETFVGPKAQTPESAEAVGGLGEAKGA